MMSAKTLVVYQRKDGSYPVTDWIHGLRDKTHRYRIEARIERIRHGNYGDHKRFQGIIEIRMDFGKGYRLYCAENGPVLVILLVAGDKTTQDKDIQKALEYWRDYNE